MCNISIMHHEKTAYMEMNIPDDIYGALNFIQKQINIMFNTKHKNDRIFFIKYIKYFL